MNAARKTKGPPPRIGIVSDEPAVTARIEAALKSSGYTVAFAVTPQELEKHPPDMRDGVVVLTDQPHPGNSAVIAHVRERFPQAHLIACMAPVKLRGLRLAIDLGLDGVIWDAHLEQTLDSSIRAVCDGQLVVPRDSYQRLEPPHLTNREKQTLSMVIMGLTNQEIAEKLFISEGTVKSHLNKAYRKLGVRSRGEAARLIADPAEGLGTGILAITRPGHARAHARSSEPGPARDSDRER
jgi:DNA-binding NarL/FixJ family response regulator